MRCGNVILKKIEAIKKSKVELHATFNDHEQRTNSQSGA